MGSSGPEWCPLSDFCEHGDETLGFVKGEEYLDHLSNYQLLKNNSGFIQSLNWTNGNVE
jgi:hypothetical protein